MVIFFSSNLSLATNKIGDYIYKTSSHLYSLESTSFLQVDTESWAINRIYLLLTALGIHILLKSAWNLVLCTVSYTTVVVHIRDHKEFSFVAKYVTNSFLWHLGSIGAFRVAFH